jgi:hypothetical protein
MDWLVKALVALRINCVVVGAIANINGVSPAPKKVETDSVRTYGGSKSRDAAVS